MKRQHPFQYARPEYSTHADVEQEERASSEDVPQLAVDWARREKTVRTDEELSNIRCHTLCENQLDAEMHAS
jgi:hypothetical protein